MVLFFIMTNVSTEIVPDRSTASWEQLGQLVDANVAEVAAEHVLDIMRQPELGFLYDASGDDLIRYLGIWRPRATNDWGTIYAHPEAIDDHRILIDVIESVTISDKRFTAINHVAMMVLNPGDSVPEHQDFTRDGSRKQRRRIINLAGFCFIACVDPFTGSSDAFPLGPGQGYDLEVTDSPETSPLHSVEAVGSLPRVSLMLVSKELAE